MISECIKKFKNKMDAKQYYEKEFDIDGKKYKVTLYEYGRGIAMVSDESFGKGFSKVLKSTLGGRYNPKLSVGSGWIFKRDRETQEKLNNFLRDVFTGKIKMDSNEIRMPSIQKEDIDNRVFNMVKELIDCVPEETEERQISEQDGVKTFIYYNKQDSTVIQGDTIYSFESSKKSFEITQLRM